jgi:hypothetical protein
LYYIRSQNANLQKGVRSFPIPAKAGSTLSAKSMDFSIEDPSKPPFSSLKLALSLVGEGQ